jgi:hypothetical protein
MMSMIRKQRITPNLKKRQIELPEFFMKNNIILRLSKKEDTVYAFAYDMIKAFCEKGSFKLQGCRHGGIF